MFDSLTARLFFASFALMLAGVGLLAAGAGGRRGMCLRLGTLVCRGALLCLLLTVFISAVISP